MLGATKSIPFLGCGAVGEKGASFWVQAGGSQELPWPQLRRLPPRWAPGPGQNSLGKSTGTPPGLPLRALSPPPRTRETKAGGWGISSIPPPTSIPIHSAAPTCLGEKIWGACGGPDPTPTATESRGGGSQGWVAGGGHGIPSEGSEGCSGCPPGGVPVRPYLGTAASPRCHLPGRMVAATPGGRTGGGTGGGTVGDTGRDTGSGDSSAVGRF